MSTICNKDNKHNTRMKTWRKLVEWVQLNKHDKTQEKNQAKVVERIIQWEEIRKWIKKRPPLDACTDNGINEEKIENDDHEHPDPSWTK